MSHGSRTAACDGAAAAPPATSAVTTSVAVATTGSSALRARLTRFLPVIVEPALTRASVLEHRDAVEIGCVRGSVGEFHSVRPGRQRQVGGHPTGCGEAAGGGEHDRLDDH